MASDDVHDLFGRDEADESDDLAEDEPGTESDESTEWNDLPSLEDEGAPAASARDETVGPGPASPGDSDEEGSDEYEATGSTATYSKASEPSEASDADAFEPAVSSTSSGEPIESDAGDVADDAGEFEMAEPTTDTDGAAEDGAAQTPEGGTGRTAGDDTGEFEPAGSTSSGGFFEDGTEESDSTERPTTSTEGATEGDAAESVPAESTTTSAGESVEDDVVESATTGPGASPEASTDDDASESETAEATTSTVGSAVDDASELESAEPTTAPEETLEDGTSDPRSPASSSSSVPASTAGEAAEYDDDPFESPAETNSPDDVTAGKPGDVTAGERDDAAVEERDASEPEGATASTDGTITDDRGTTESAGAATSTVEPTDADHGEVETVPPDDSGSGASGPAVASGMAVDDGMAAGDSGSNRLPTGIDELDRAMGGGIPPGRLVVLVADPGVQSELIVDSVLAQRDTLFVTTDRPDWEVLKDIEPGLGSGEVLVQDHTPDSLLSGLDSLLDDLGTSSNFVLDSVNELELVPRKRYRIFLSDVKRRLFDTGSIGLFTGVTVGHESARDLTLRRADVVLRLETRTTGHEIENRLSVPKFRGGAALTETVKLELTDEVRVDHS